MHSQCSFVKILQPVTDKNNKQNAAAYERALEVERLDFPKLNVELLFH